MKTRVILLGLLLGATTGATQTVDQSYDPAEWQVSYGVSGTHTRAQTFTVGRDGQLVGIDIYSPRMGAELLYWDLRPTDSGVPAASRLDALASGSVLASTLPSPTSFHYFDLTAFNLGVTTGQVYAITLWGASGNTVGSFSGTTNNGYAGGAAFTGETGVTTAWSELADTDFKFRTHVIPEPSTYALALGIAALGLAVWRRRGM